MSATWNQAIEATDRVIEAHGGSFLDLETGKRMDPGQLICREAYGADWMHSEDFKACDRAKECPDSYMKAATRLTKQLPKWCEVLK